MTARHFATAFLALSSLTSTCQAESHLSGLDNLQVHGFLTQGFIKTDHNRFFGPSDKGSFEFTEIGLNGSYRPLPSLLLAGQVLSRRAGNMYDGSPTVDFGLARWEMVDNGKYQAAVSVGRFKNPIGLYNTTRDVAHTRPSVLVPQSIYFDRVRNLLMSSDGVMLHLNNYSESGEFSFDIGMGRPILDKNVEYVLLGRDWPGSLEPERLSGIGQLRFTTPDGRWRSALSYANTAIGFRPTTGPGPGPGHTSIGYLVASLEFNQGDWSVTGEYLYEPVNARGYGGPLDDKFTGEAYYLQVNRYIGTSVRIHARYEEAYHDRHDRDGEMAALKTGLPASQFFARSWTAGVRWDLNSHLMLSADFSHTDGNFFLSKLDNPNPASLKRRWNMLSVLVSYRF